MKTISIQIQCDNENEAQSINNRIPTIISIAKGFLKGNEYDIKDEDIERKIVDDTLIVYIYLKREA